MKINRSNYEIWFIDSLDGNLNSLEAEELNQFLNENPDLKEEFNELTPVIINQSVHQFKDKESLKKNQSDISDSQFEFLCIAHLEMDLTPDQQSELTEIIEQDPIKKKSFELIQKTRIAAPVVTYKYKSHLLRRTPLQKAIRLSVIGLSAAASIVLAVSLYLNAPEQINQTQNNTSTLIITESNILKSPYQEKAARVIPVIEDKAVVAKSEVNAIIPYDSVGSKPAFQDITVSKINFTSDIALSQNLISSTLIASNITFSIPEEDDGRSNISRFISKTFRERILNETTTLNTPLKGYEIAEAGVTGLNKLLGWEMALDKNNDENGELNSVYFSSKLLKFNSPVKKSEPEP